MRHGLQVSGGRLNIKIQSFQYKDCCYKDKLLWEMLHLERSSLYWDRALMMLAEWLDHPDKDWGNPHQHWIMDKLQCMMGSHCQWNLSHLSKANNNSSRTALTAGISGFSVEQGDCERVYRTHFITGSGSYKTYTIWSPSQISTDNEFTDWCLDEWQCD